MSQTDRHCAPLNTEGLVPADAEAAYSTFLDAYVA